MVLTELLSDEELIMMDNYRKWHAWSENGTYRMENYVPMSEILQEWAKQKSDHLFQLFGEKLIISKYIQYEKSYEELQDALSDMMQTDYHFDKKGRNGSEFIKNWNRYIGSNRTVFSEEIINGLFRLTSDDCLISNTYDGDTFEVPIKLGKKYRVQFGCKVSKALGKLADIFGLSGWEDFRICHSEILNQKSLGGELTLSIHPMDYMTMSDNDIGWESCMSWRNEGSYRQGTVEMMNSPTVVVAYLSASDEMDVDNKHRWNNKKWRQLFIVDKNIVVGVKDYPFRNEELGREIVAWLKDLAEENLHWKYQNIIPYEYDSQYNLTTKNRVVHQDEMNLYEDEESFNLHFVTRSMYNDFGCIDSHYLTLSKDLSLNDLHQSNYGKPTLQITYSGTSQCMICGELHPTFSDESCLACMDCQYRQLCDCCGSVADEIYSIDGINLCTYCYESRTFICTECGEEHYEDNAINIFIIPHFTKEEQKDIKKEFNELKKSNRFYMSAFMTTEDEELNEFNYFKSYPDISLCEDGKCLESWIKANMVPGCRPHIEESRYYSRICVYFEELTPEAREDLDIEEDQDEFKTTMCLRHKPEPTKFIKFL